MIRPRSSVWPEQLLCKQRVGGSTPSVGPTLQKGTTKSMQTVFDYHSVRITKDGDTYRVFTEREDVFGTPFFGEAGSFSISQSRGAQVLALEHEPMRPLLLMIGALYLQVEAYSRAERERRDARNQELAERY
jgi:hypothetical protein